MNVRILAELIFIMPLAAFGLMALFHHKLPRHGDWFATAIMGICLVFSLVIFGKAWNSPDAVFMNFVFAWLPMRGANMLPGGLMVDSLTGVMLVVVTSVSFLVYLFSSKYMEGDVRYGRYYCCLLLFTTSMLGLVLANNLLYLFIFWELVGLSSYLLIGHWFEKKSASNAAIKAFLTTRVGDVGMIVGLMVCYKVVGSLHYADLFSAVANGTLAGSMRTVAGLGLFFAAMGKSAQFPLHVWLPDAMEGPTPVSALIHAATMVAAGVYLTGRLLPMFDETTLLFIAYIGAVTTLFAATIALVQDDIKKVLAYSTVSQLGQMIMALGVGGYVAGLFHLTTHAFFKAGLFLGSGAVIYAMHHEQSMSKYGGLRKKMPWTALTYLCCTLAIAGIPPLAGFWSKDLILGDTLAFSLQHGHYFLPVAGFLTAFLTAFYMFRQYFLTFTGKPRDHHAYEHAHEVPWQMLLPLVLLAILAVIGGGRGKWFEAMNPMRSGVEQAERFEAKEAVQQTARTESHTDAESSHQEGLVHEAHNIAMKLSVALGVVGILLSSLFFLEKKSGKTVLSPGAVAEKFRPVHKLLWNKYYIDELYDFAIIRLTLFLSAICAAFDRIVIDSFVNLWGILAGLGGRIAELCDRLFVDGVFVNGSANLTARMGNSLSYLQTGYIRQYLALMLLGSAVISFLYVWAL